jgi:hypothetical protein
MTNWSKFIPMVLSCLLTICLAPSAKADQTENLVFTGTATCVAVFIYQECPVGGVGPVTGNYTLDVTSQMIVGAWSFATPYGVISSSDAGASAYVQDDQIIGADVDDTAIFQLLNPPHLEFLQFYFPAYTELGPLESLVTNVPLNVLCQEIPGTTSCEPDVIITGANALAPTPEPGTCGLMLIGVGLLGLMMVMRKRIAQLPRLNTGTHHSLSLPSPH